jgi:hypothetical protein
VLASNEITISMTASAPRGHGRRPGGGSPVLARGR